MRLFLVFLALSITNGVYVQSSQEIFDDAVNDWNEGDYLEALTSFENILKEMMQKNTLNLSPFKPENFSR